MKKPRRWGVPGLWASRRDGFYTADHRAKGIYTVAFLFSRYWALSVTSWRERGPLRRGTSEMVKQKLT